jgi:hypothetical protein
VNLVGLVGGICMVDVGWKCTGVGLWLCFPNLAYGSLLAACKNKVDVFVEVI